VEQGPAGGHIRKQEGHCEQKYDATLRLMPITVAFCHHPAPSPPPAVPARGSGGAGAGICLNGRALLARHRKARPRSPPTPTLSLRCPQESRAGPETAWFSAFRLRSALCCPPGWRGLISKTQEGVWTCRNGETWPAGHRGATRVVTWSSAAAASQPSIWHSMQFYFFVCPHGVGCLINAFERSLGAGAGSAGAAR